MIPKAINRDPNKTADLETKAPPRAIISMQSIILISVSLLNVSSSHLVSSRYLSK
jgi:hypothetical protein